MPWSSNATFLAELVLDGATTLAIYKPERGERPLWDFPSGLYKREIAAYLLSEALGWGLVPLTIARDGPYGEGSFQLFVDADFEQHFFTLVRTPPTTTACAACALRPPGQQRRPQERPLPARPRRAPSTPSTTA